MIVIDRISRKYYTAETSWLWDINFSYLANPGISKVYLCGKYAFDAAVRVKACTDCTCDIVTVTSVALGAQLASDDSSSGIYVLTCFSDAEKTIREFNKINE